MTHMPDMKDLFISIIIPIYNARTYLMECLHSVLQQSYPNFEVICVDDGSTDESGMICQRLAEQDGRLKYLRQENAGVSAARNLGLDYATGDYICFVDADDCIAKDFLSTLLNGIKGNDAIICDFTQGEGLGHKGRIKEVSVKQIINDIVFERIKHPGLYCFMYKSDIIKDNDIRFVVGCIKNEDTEFYLNYLACCNGIIALTSYVGYYYRPNPASVMNKPMTIDSFTSIEASRRTNEVLYKKHILNSPNVMFYNSILVYAYGTAKRNAYFYAYLHDKYDVKTAMKYMLFNFPRISKKMVALFYLVVGKNVFKLVFNR